MDKKISSEFAIAVILIVAGTFTYVFWNGAKNISTDSVSTISISNENKVPAKQEKKEEWKIFRNADVGYEFSLPKDWKLKEARGTFVTQDEAGEINVSIEENDKDYSVEELLAENIKMDAKASIQPLAVIDGIVIEKKETDGLNRTAKILQGGNIVTLAYLSKSEQDGSAELFNKIIQTFKAVD